MNKFTQVCAGTWAHRMQVDLLIRKLQLATLADAAGYGEVRGGALAVHAGRIAWLGPESELPETLRAAQEVDGQGGWLTPGQIDCHTHLVYAGSRANEIEMRWAGAAYEDIARAGGGISSTVRATSKTFAKSSTVIQLG